MTLYHSEIGFPDLPLPLGKIKLTYSKHALQEARKDRYSVINLPLSVFVVEGQIFEMAVVCSEIIKIGIRIPYSTAHDLVLIVKPKSGFVITCWLNEKHDKHTSLDKTRYSAVK